MVSIAFLLCITLDLKTYLGQEENNDVNTTETTTQLIDELKSTHDPNLLNFENFHTKGDEIKDDKYKDYSDEHSEDDLEDDLYADYDYGGKLYYEERTDTSTTKQEVEVEPNSISFGGDNIPLHSKDNLPVFLLEPENAFAVKNKPATLRCRAANALEVYFKCNGIKTKTMNFEFVDPHNGVRIIEGEYNITREELEEYFGKDRFKCTCFAWTGRGQIRSQYVFVDLAYIKKQFTLAPHSQLVEQYAAVTLHCEPPPASPPPLLYWLKNGAPIVFDTNVKTNENEELIIGQVSLQDMANYSCVAENVAGKKISDPALLTVYVNGGWSPWSTWSDCTCQGHPTSGRRRIRTCTDPRPLNGGQVCTGPDIQKTPDCVQCKIDMYVDIEDELPDTSQLHTGMWSSWSEWSHCDSECLQSRRRRCLSSAGCLGKDYQITRCLMCTYHGPTTSYWPLLIGSVVAVTIFFVIIIAGIKYLKFNFRDHSNYVKTRTDLPQDYFDNSVKTFQPSRPDLTLHDSVENPHFTRSQRGNSSDTIHKMRQEHLYEVPQLNNSYVAPADYEQPLYKRTAPHSDNYGHKLYSTSEHSESSCFASSETSYGRESAGISPSMKNNLSTDSELARGTNLQDSQTSISATIGCEAEWLRLDKCGVGVYFPDGAVDVRETFWIEIVKEDWNRPLLPEGMTQLSPVIKCGPYNSPLRKPVIVKFPHCAMLKNSNWILSLLEQKPDQHCKQWSEVLTLGEETNNNSMFLQVDTDTAFLMTEHLCDFVLVGKSFRGYDIKLLKIAVFASEPNNVVLSNYNLRVYIFEDTLCALYYCLENERVLGGQLVDNPKTMYCQDGCSDLCFNLEEVGLGWKAKAGTAYQEIPFAHVWNANLNSLHCSFILEQTDSINNLEFKIVVFQKKCPSNRQVFNVRPQENIKNVNFNSTNERKGNNSLNKIGFHIFENPIDSYCTKNVNSNDYCTNNDSCIVVKDESVNLEYSRIKLCSSDKKILCALLDAPVSKGNDWRMLVDKLKITKYYEYFSNKPSPTENVLNLWGCRNPGINGLVELATIFRLIERNDCANIIERYLGPNWL